MKKLDLTRLQNAEHLALMNDTHSLLTEAKIEALNSLKTELKTGTDKAEAGVLQVKKNEHTQELATLDDKRDAIYRGLVLRVQSEEYSLTEDVRKAAQKVALVVKTYGNFTAHNYQKETTEIQNFVADLKSEEYRSAAEMIGVTQWVIWLEIANNAFHTLYTQRRDDYAGKTAYDMKNIRKELDETFRKIIQTIEALAILQPSEALMTLMNKLNASIEKWNEVLAQRGRRKTEKTEKPKEGEHKEGV